MIVMIFQGPFDDMIAFAVSAKESGVGVDICNQDTFGYVMTPLSGEGKALEDDLSILTNIMTEVTTHFLCRCWMVPCAFRLYRANCSYFVSKILPKHIQMYLQGSADE